GRSGRLDGGAPPRYFGAAVRPTEVAMSIIFYGATMGSSARTHWMLEEVGAPYEVKQVNLRDPALRSEDMAKVNPGGKIPCLADGDFKLFESMAINFYLAEKYKPELLPQDAAGRALAYQWSFWAITNLQLEVMRFLQNTTFLPEAERNPKIAEAA